MIHRSIPAAAMLDAKECRNVWKPRTRDHLLPFKTRRNVLVAFSQVKGRFGFTQNVNCPPGWLFNQSAITSANRRCLRYPYARRARTTKPRRIFRQNSPNGVRQKIAGPAHYSRKALGFAVFKKQPTSWQLRQFLDRIIAKVGTAPKYLVTDSGTQFTCHAFNPWCRRRGIRHRKGAVGQTGSIAVVERFIRTLKDNCTRVLPVVPLARRAFRHEILLFSDWINRFRPHMTLGGATPDEVYFDHRPANRSPRFEPRPRWPRGLPCATPQTLVKGQPGVALKMHIKFVGTRRALPSAAQPNILRKNQTPFALPLRPSSPNNEPSSNLPIEFAERRPPKDCWTSTSLSKIRFVPSFSRSTWIRVR
jgi:Integrase core domain